MPFNTLFTPSASVTFVPVPENPTTFSLPAYDATNLDLTVANNGFGPVSMGFGPGANAAGLTVQPGTTALLTGNAATLAACGINPLVVSAGTVPGSSTSCNAIVSQRGGSVTVSRGTALSRPSF